MALLSDQNSLLVPIHVDAWSVDPTNQQSVCSSIPQYSALAAYKSPIPFPFSVASASATVGGIQLHWALPDALTHGQQESLGEPVTFPLVPNRWQITRLNASSGQWVAEKVTVICSDYLDPTAGASPYLDPFQPSTYDQVRQTQVGKSYDIQTWQARADPDSGELFLQAVGPGDVIFSSYTPFMREVFSYIDPGDGLPPPGTGIHRYAYEVIGWYSDPAQGDPLRSLAGGDPASTNQRFLDLLAQLDWTVAGLEAWLPSVWPTEQDWQKSTPLQRLSTLLVNARLGAPPDTTLYQSVTYDVQWPASPAVPSANTVRVAIGNSTMDALAALVDHDAGDFTDPEPRRRLARLLQAAQYDLLDEYDKPGGDATIDDELHRAWFGTQPGGTVWGVVVTPPDSAGEDAAQVELSAEQRSSLDAQLASLNRQQHAFDTASRELAAAQAELYRQWYKFGQSSYISSGWPGTPYSPGDLYPTDRTPQWFDFSQPGDPITYDYRPDHGLQTYFETVLYPRMQQEVWQMTCAVNAAGASLPDPNDPDAIQQWADEHIALPDGNGTTTLTALGLMLQPTGGRRFHEPNDLVVLFAGADRARKHGEDGRHDDAGLMRCRLPGQTITALNVDGTIVSAAALSAAGLKLDPLGSFTRIPRVPSLRAEAFLADFNNAPLIARAMRLPEVSVAAAMRTAESEWPNPRWIGVAPARFAQQAWTQGWAPLMLEWTARYYPTGTGTGNDRQFSIADWRFDGRDYQWAGTGYESSQVTTYSGSTLVTPQSSSVLAGKIAALGLQDPSVDPAELRELVERITSWDILSQSLGGLTEQLLTLGAQEGFPPSSDPPGPVACPPDDNPPDVAALIGDNWRNTPVVVNNSERFGGGVRNFYPVRGGFVTFDRLRLIDTFGQFVELAGPTGPQGFTPILGEGLTPHDPHQKLPQGALQLPPRAAQSSRLDMTLLAQDGEPLLLSHRPDPIDGWLLPNHLDRGLSVYDGGGVLLGEVMSSGPPDNWRPRPGPPGDNPPPATPSNIRNPVLRAVVSSIAAQPTAVFDDFMQVIDETLWMVDPLGGRADQQFSSLIGRPLAVVQARMRLELNGPPTPCQFWQAMARGSSVDQGMAQPPWQPAPYDGEILHVPFSMRLGSLERRDDGLLGYYSDDYSTFNAVHMPERSAPGDTYIRQIGDGNYLDVKYESSVTVTMIVDPRGAVHATAGILPTAAVALPAHAVEDFLASLQVTFRTGPLIADPGTLRIPEPAEEGTWTWVQRIGTGTGDEDWQSEPIVDATDAARLPDAVMQLREGWLKLDEP